MARARWYLDHGVSVLFFPEGTRSKDGDVQAFKAGAFKLALEAGEARSAIAAGAVTGARHVVEGPRAAAHGLADVAFGDTPADAQNHRIASLSSNLKGQYRF